MINHPVWIHGAAILMVLHGSHQYTPVMLAFFYQHQPDPSWAMKFWGVPFFFQAKSNKDMLIGGLEHVLFSPIVGMMIQSD